MNRSALLDRAAEQWATGSSPAEAVKRSGYEADITTSLRISGTDSASVQLLKTSGCRALANQALHDIGVYRRGLDTWIMLASRYLSPPSLQGPILAARALQLVNEARARGALRRTFVCTGAAGQIIRDTRYRRIRTRGRHGAAQLL